MHGGRRLNDGVVGASRRESSVDASSPGDVHIPLMSTAL